MRLLMICVVLILAATAFSLLKGNRVDSPESEAVLSAPTPPGKPNIGSPFADQGTDPTRTPAVAQQSEVAVAPTVEAQPESRLEAASWMSARDAAFAVTPEERLNELLQLRMAVDARGKDSLALRQQMAALASVALATHLDKLGESTTSPVQPGAYQWKFAVGGAFYIVNQGKFPAFDAVLTVYEDAAQAITANTERDGMLITDTPSSGPSLDNAKPIPDDTFKQLNTLVEGAIVLLTTYE